MSPLTVGGRIVAMKFHIRVISFGSIEFKKPRVLSNKVFFQSANMAKKEESQIFAKPCQKYYFAKMMSCETARSLFFPHSNLVFLL